MIRAVWKAMLGRLVILLLSVGVAACVTTGMPPKFTAQQTDALRSTGFVQVGDNFELDLSARLLFDFDSSTVKDEMAEEIHRVAKVLLGANIKSAKIIGHTDATGTEDYNKSLSLRRARSVSELMIESGFESSSMRVDGLGEADPIDTNTTEDGRLQNRRVVIIVTPKDASQL